MAATSIDYIGDELSLFEAATNWKAYLRRTLLSYIRNDVAEVGAGLGATTRALGGGETVRSWLAIEPDPTLFRQLSDPKTPRPQGHPVEFFHGTLADLAPGQSFDTIIYIDVLEHIEDDRAELARAASRLRPGGRIVILCPAFQSVYSPFDKAIGHYRRYTIGMLRAVAPTGLREISAFYRDSVGLVASFANKLALRQSMPTLSQVRLWDQVMVPLSRLVDPLVGSFFGKSVVLILERPVLSQDA